MKLMYALILTLVLSFSCWKATPPVQGTTAPPREMGVYRDRMIQPAEGSNYQSDRYQNGYSQFSGKTSNYQSLGCDILKHIKICIFYNSNVSLLISSWHVPEVDVLEFTTKGDDVVSKRIFTERHLPYQHQIQDIDAILSATIEEKIIQILLRSKTRIIDKKLVLRQTADDEGLTDLREAEIRAIRDKADLLIEVEFLPTVSSPDGYEIKIKAIRSRDAAILAYRTSAEIDDITRRRYSFVAVEGGYMELPMRLEDLTEILMNDVLRDICMNW